MSPPADPTDNHENDADPLIPIAVDPPRWVIPVVSVPIAAVVIAGYISGAFWPSLLDDHPLWLLALAPGNRNLLLTTNVLDAWSYFGVGLARHLFPDPFFALLGWWYGDRAVRWAADVYPALGRLVPENGRVLGSPKVRRYMVPLALLAPNNWVSLLAGATRLPPRLFLMLNVTGTLLRLALCRWLGRAFDDQIGDIAGWIARYQGRLTLVTVVLVAVGLAVQMRSGKGELAGLSRLDEELRDHDGE